jgi:hypothetical protein
MVLKWRNQAITRFDCCSMSVIEIYRQQSSDHSDVLATLPLTFIPSRTTIRTRLQGPSTAFPNFRLWPSESVVRLFYISVLVRHRAALRR